MRRALCVCLLATTAAASAPGVSEATAARACGNEAGYAYAGLQSLRRAHGVRATITALAPPYVRAGHVAAWVGVGGRGQGAGGTDQWLQAGLAAFPGSPDTRLYYEVTAPGSLPRFHQVVSRVETGAPVRVAVLEMARRPSHWRVWVNGHPVSEPIHLPSSGARWRPIATAEAWDGGRQACNGFGYRFDRVGVARASGGAWTRFRSGYRLQDPGFRVVQRRTSAFRALATAVPVWKPGWWQSRTPGADQAAARSAALPTATG